MKEFFRLERVPQFDLATAPFPISQEFHRLFSLSPDLADPAHRLYLSGIWRTLINIDRNMQRHAYLALTREGVSQTIREFYGSRPADSYYPDSVDLYYLYAHIRERRPKVVLEFGSGMSTAVMAHALAKNGEGHLYSLDASERWAESTARALPTGLRKFATVEYRGPLQVNILGHSTFCFETPPVDSADMIYVDGAAHEKAIFSGAENIEFLDMRPDSCIYVDHRIGAVDYFRTKLSLTPQNTPRYRIHSYMVIVKGFHELLYSPCGADLFSNTLVRVI